jgi:hypothetical protein
VLVTEHFQAEAGGHGGHDLQQSRRITFRYGRKWAIDFGANLPANFGLARSVSIRSNSFITVAGHGLESLQRLTSHFSTACTATSIRFATEWLPREAEHCRYELFNAKTISICYRFFSR